MAPHNSNAKRLEILERRKKVARRYLRGETQWEIARAFEVAQATICTDLKVIQKEWEEEAKSSRQKWRMRQLATIDEVQRRAWASFEKSLENAEVLRAKMRGDKPETEKVTTGQAGDPRFLDLVLKCVRQRCDILGLMLPPDDEDEDDPNRGDADRVVQLLARVREAVERCRSRISGGTGGEPGQAPPLEPPARSADDGASEPS